MYQYGVRCFSQLRPLRLLTVHKGKVSSRPSLKRAGRPTPKRDLQKGLLLHRRALSVVCIPTQIDESPPFTLYIAQTTEEPTDKTENVFYALIGNRQQAPIQYDLYTFNLYKVQLYAIWWYIISYTFESILQTFTRHQALGIKFPIEFSMNFANVHCTNIVTLGFAIFNLMWRVPYKIQLKRRALNSTYLQTTYNFIRGNQIVTTLNHEQ